MVKAINLKSVGISATFQIGDIKTIKPRTKIIAVQREIPIYYGDEGNFNSFPIFSKSIPKPVIHEEININRVNLNPFIQVDTIHVLGVSSSGVFQVGSNDYIDSEARTKNIRQLLQGEYPI